MKTKPLTPDFASLVQRFFSQRLITQRNASPRTVEAYRDMFRLLFQYLQTHLNKSPSSIRLADLEPTLVATFLDYLEKERQNSIRTRNARFAALRSFLKYASLQDPAALPTIQRVLAIPMKRYERPLLGFLSQAEVEAIVEAPNPSTWSGMRDRVLFATLYNTGARVSELVSLRVADVSLKQSLTVTLHGKGRKERVVPLWKRTADQIRQWLRSINPNPESPLFPNRFGGPLSRSGVEYQLRKAVCSATRICPTLKGRRISPHTFRHTTAMHLLQSHVDLTVIAIWLGHESPETTHLYVEADLAMKEKALRKIQEPNVKHLRYKASDRLLQFLDGL